MGGVLSTRAWSKAPNERERPTSTVDSDTPAAARVYVDEVEAEPALWSRESKCVMIQRLLGWLPDSAAENMKQEQKCAPYAPRVLSLNVESTRSRGNAIVRVQRFYRRYRLLCRWHSISNEAVDLVRQQRDERIAIEEEEDMLNNFKQLLITGFSAQKVSIGGALKNIQLQLVLKPDAQDCYLTWKPSRKRQPRIHLHDIVEVVPVLKEGNKYAPHLASKISHRRGLIIVSKSHHRGRVVLQMGSKRERKVLLLGFARLLEDLDRFVPSIDDAGVIRKRLPRRQSAIQFFDRDGRRSSDAKVDRTDSEGVLKPQRAGIVTGNKTDAIPETALPLSSVPGLPDSAVFERFYHTRYDDPEDNTSDDISKGKSLLIRRSSTVT